MAKPCNKDFELPLSGALDTRSPSGHVLFNDFRLILNMDGSEQRGYCRLGGWQPYLKDSELGFKNQDLHDQMVSGQYYHRSYVTSSTTSSEITGYTYSLFVPGHHVDEYTANGPELGPFCGYALEAPYLSEDAPNQYSISQSFTGYPYIMQFDPNCVADGGGPPEIGDFTIWEVTMKSNQASHQHGNIYAEIIWKSVLFGPGKESKFVFENPPTVQTVTFQYCLPPDATDVLMNGWQGQIIKSPTKTAPPVTCTTPSTMAAGPGPCVNEDCYMLSTYNLHYTQFYEGFDVPPYEAGDLIPVYSTTGSNTDTTNCYPEIYYVPNTCPEAVTALYAMNSVGGRRRLVAATRSRIYVNDDRNGNWRILADGLGGPCDKDDDCTCSNKRFRIAALGNTMLFSNGVDPVLAWDFDSGPDGCFFWSADYVAQLRQLFIDSAEVIQSWNGFAFIANVSENGDRLSSRVYWSDYNAPLSWFPGGESLAGYHDFGNGEKVLSMEPIGGRLRIFTDKAIYDCVLVRDPEQVFSFQEIYRGKEVLRYRFSIVNTGDTLVWMGESSIYAMAEYDRTPQRVEWIHQASGVIYEGIRAEWVQDFTGLDSFGPVNKERCDQVVGGWDSERQAIWFSWPTAGQQCPNMSLVLWPRYSKASIVDHGFTAFVNHRPDFRMSIRDFFATANFCPSSEQMVDKEGLPYSTGGSEGYPFLFNPTEDPNLPMDPNSAIASLCGVCLSDICESCDVDAKFLMASVVDKTIKEFTPKQKVREMLVDPGEAVFPDTSVGTYVDEGYYSLLQSDPYDYATPVEKLMTTVAVAFVAEVQTTPNPLSCSIAFGSQAECTSWALSDDVLLDCLDGPDYDTTTNMRPANFARFAFYSQGIYLGWRLFTHGVGGGFCVSSMTLSLRKNTGAW